ncbi:MULTISPECIES: branched-chain amino acid aminotransferase [Marinobacter]|uniref:branched-chain amino acid aminotransferase n=1 Tax=Marinobacter TaxID=2742 RepID=UPI000DACBB85|nr:MULTISPECIES: branched-chain amino acid aminotransferase [Marinobacter]
MTEVASDTASQTAAAPAPFGTQFAEKMTLARYADGQWQGVETVPVGPLPLHPASHVLHYGSSCFEGLKAYRMPDGDVRIFRLERHVARFQRSAALLCLPQPPAEMVEAMIREVVELARDIIPEAPGALYLRPTLIGTEANIGAAGASSAEALVYILASPVGDYFAGGKGLTILIEDQEMRSTPGFGQAKTGGNYAAALRHVNRARTEYDADQVLFCPGGDVQETGASNFFLIDDNRLLTKPLDPSFLHGVTRDSIITLARDLGYEVVERDFTVDEVKAWIKTGEAALSGTAAVLSGVGAFVHGDTRYPVGDGGVGPNTRKLSEALRALQSGQTPDRFGWLS